MLYLPSINSLASAGANYLIACFALERTDIKEVSRLARQYC
jgi:hypothetical protein